MTRKLSKSQIASLAEIHKMQGAIMSSEWVTGSGRYISGRAIPAHCAKLTIQQGIGLGGWVGKRCKRIQRDHPRVMYVIAITDLRQARSALR